MPDSIDSPEDLHDIFTLIPDDEYINRRKAVRYVRDDITAVLIKKGLLKSTDMIVKLLEISSKGALISCSMKLGINKKVTLRLVFKDGKKFNLKATVIHIGTTPPGKQYGLEFNKLSNRLGEHLLSTQIDLVLK